MLPTVLFVLYVFGVPLAAWLLLRQVPDASEEAIACIAWMWPLVLVIATSHFLYENIRARFRGRTK
jgi:hypothetical protein